MVRPRKRADIKRYHKKIEAWIYRDQIIDLGQIVRKIGCNTTDFHEALTTDTALRQAITTGLVKLRSKLIQRILDASKDKNSEINVPASRAALALCQPDVILPPAADSNAMTFDLAAYLNDTGEEG